MLKSFTLTGCLILLVNLGFGQSASFQTYTNPVVPGDHPDCTLTRVGSDYYTTGSSFNPTPVIYHSTDLVHWEAVAQPVSAAWTNYDTRPSGGCWGGQVVYYNNKWWDFFGMRFTMYFVTANAVRGPWSQPTLMNCPSSVPGLGADNSIFVDDNGNWYLLVKNGQVNNWIIQLGSDGQPRGAIYNLCWINPSPSYPYSWAEGPVMWKYHGYYYYCFARDVAGGQYFMRSKTLTDSSSSWTTPANFFNQSDPLASSALFGKPNHSSAAVMLDDSTSWVLHPVWRDGDNDSEWYGQGRQGLFNQVHYDTNGKPTADYPDNVPRNAPKLPSSGIPWMVPHSDFFDSSVLNPEWSFLGYTPSNSHSLTGRTSWLTLSPNGKLTTVIKNDGEHNYSLITRLAFDPRIDGDSAGLWIFNGLQTLSAKLFKSIDSSGKKVVTFSYKTTRYVLTDPTNAGDSALWLKLVRVNHTLTGFCGTDGYDWIQIGNSIDVAEMDGLQPNWNAWTGNRHGLFAVGGVSASFDFYIYRDAYTPILAECPANQYGTTVSARVNGISSLSNIADGDWALYAGLEFGNPEYVAHPDSLQITASCASSGGVVEVWLDSIGTGNKIAECSITGTGSWANYKTFTTNVLASVSGNHDVYLRFKGAGPGNLFMIQWLNFEDKAHPMRSVRE